MRRFPSRNLWRISSGGLVLLVAAISTAALLTAAPAAAAEGQVHQIKVVTDKAPDCSSLKTICDSVTRDCKTNDEKAVALYNFMQLSHYHLGYPGESGGLPALKEINVYGWSLCGGLHTVEAALYRQMGWKWHYVGWSNPGHTTVEAFYDDKWHYLDVFLRFYAWMPDANAPGGRTVAGQQDIKNDPLLVTHGLDYDKGRKVYYHHDNRFETIDGKANWTAPCFLDCGDGADGVISGIKSNQQSGSPTGWAGLVFDDQGYNTDVNLSPGNSLELDWSAIEGAQWWNGSKALPAHTCGDKDYRNCPAIGPILEPYHAANNGKRSFASGRLVFAPDLNSQAALAGFAAKDNVKLEGGKLAPADASRPASVTVQLQSPYIMTKGSGKVDGVESAEVSLDGGKTFKSTPIADFSAAIAGKYEALVKLTFKAPISELRLEAIVQHNRCALPYLSPGKNKVTVSAGDAAQLGDNQLVVTYAYETGFRTKSYEKLADMDAELAKGIGATWATTPTVVQKVLKAKDLPATFEIDVPTPKGKYTVYPRMLFLRREVIAAGAKPQPLPEGAAAPTVGPGDELVSMPNPFTIGLALPPPKDSRPISLRTIELKTSHAVSADGEAAENHYLKAKPKDTWAILIGGEIKDLPAAKDIAAARLVFPVTRGHAQAATKAVASLLKADFTPDKPFDFKNLGDEAGTTRVPKQPDEKEYNPPKTFVIDVTRAVKQLAAGDAKYHGFALRTAQDRAVDEGYTTRLDLPAHAPVKLELDVYGPRPTTASSK